MNSIREKANGMLGFLRPTSKVCSTKIKELEREAIMCQTHHKSCDCSVGSSQRQVDHIPDTHKLQRRAAFFFPLFLSLFCFVLF